MDKQPKTYYIIIGNAPHIMRTWGADEDEARQRAFALLNRGGRYGLLQKWQDSGSELQEVKCQEL